jgi:hypothetical protein
MKLDRKIKYTVLEKDITMEHIWGSAGVYTRVVRRFVQNPTTINLRRIGIPIRTGSTNEILSSIIGDINRRGFQIITRLLL